MKSAVTEEASAVIASETLNEISRNVHHYNDQAKYYSNLVLIMRIIIMLCSVMAAIVLAVANGEWSRRMALVLSILASAIPEVDQVFQVSELYRISWRTTVEISRIYDDCRDELAILMPPVSQTTQETVRTVAARCRQKLGKLVDKEMDFSLKQKPIALPGKIEPKLNQEK